jgi:hypothetical protein
MPSKDKNWPKHGTRWSKKRADLIEKCEAQDF